MTDDEKKRVEELLADLDNLSEIPEEDSLNKVNICDGNSDDDDDICLKFTNDCMWLPIEEKETFKWALAGESYLSTDSLLDQGYKMMFC